MKMKCPILYSTKKKTPKWIWNENENEMSNWNPQIMFVKQSKGHMMQNSLAASKLIVDTAWKLLASIMSPTGTHSLVTAWKSRIPFLSSSPEWVCTEWVNIGVSMIATHPARRPICLYPANVAIFMSSIIAACPVHGCLYLQWPGAPEQGNNLVLGPHQNR